MLKAWKAPGMDGTTEFCRVSAMIDWAQILQKNPALASAFADSQMNQGILSMLP